MWRPLFFLPLLGVVSSASAQEEPSETAVDEARVDGDQSTAAEEAQPLIAEAVGDYNAGRFQEAYALFARAHAIQPTARTLRGLGMAAFDLRHYARALEALEGALVARARPLTEAQRSHVEGLIIRAERYVGRYTVQVIPGTATFTLDGRVADLREDGTLLLSLGTHELRVDCPDCQPRTRSLIVEGGEREEVVLDASPLLDAPPPEEEPTPVVAPTPDVETRDDAMADTAPHGPPVGPIVVGGVGALMVGVGIALGVAAFSKQSALEEACPTRTGCDDESMGLQNDARAFALAADVLWIGGAFAMGGALLWWLLSGSDGDDEAASVSMGCSPVGCSARLEVGLP